MQEEVAGGIIGKETTRDRVQQSEPNGQREPSAKEGIGEMYYLGRGRKERSKGKRR